jgi:hypothetical protein
MIKIREIDATGNVEPPQSPSVGIFWGIAEGNNQLALLTQRTNQLQAEPYGDFLTHPNGHYEVWEQLNELPLKVFRARDLPEQIRTHEYEFYPRGRVVYEIPQKRFFLYRDSKLANESFVAVATRWFNLTNETVVIRSDEHYRTA